MIERLQNAMTFFPSREISMTPADLHTPFEDLYIATPDGEKIHAWYINGHHQKTILYLHGNGGNISDRAPIAAVFSQMGYDVLMPDYRGYGKSTGKPSEAGVYRDARAAYDELVVNRGIAPKQVVIFGSSLGGAVAVHLASEVPAAGLILESTFTSARDVARAAYRYFPLRFFMKNSFCSIDRAARLTLPKLVTHGDADSIIPFHLGHKLFEALPEPKFFYAVKGADHNDLWNVGGRAYVQRLGQFIAAL